MNNVKLAGLARGRIFTTVTVAGLFLATYFLIAQSFSRLALFWVLGGAFGFVLARSRFCFVSGFSNFYIFRDGRMLKAIIAGMFVATIGFAFIMRGWVPDPSTGNIPPGAYASPFGWHLVLAGLLFGLGMVLAGCCIAGSLYRIAGGFFYAFVALAGVIIGMGTFLLTRDLWWSGIYDLAPIWLPTHLGWGLSVFTILGLLAVLYLVVWLLEVKVKTGSGAETGFGQALRSKFKDLPGKALVQTWPALAGGVLLGLINIAAYRMVDRPWGITGEVQRWAEITFNSIGISTGPVSTVPGT